MKAMKGKKRGGEAARLIEGKCHNIQLCRTAHIKDTSWANGLLTVGLELPVGYSERCKATYSYWK